MAEPQAQHEDDDGGPYARLPEPVRLSQTVTAQALPPVVGVVWPHDPLPYGDGANHADGD